MTRKTPWLALAACAVVGCGQPVAVPPPPVGAEVAPAPRPSALGVIDQANRDRAALECAAFEKGCAAFALKHNGEQPPSLGFLVDPPDELKMKPLIEGGLAALRDPWGGQYMYEVTVDERKVPTPVVFAIAPDGTAVYSPKWASKSK